MNSGAPGHPASGPAAQLPYVGPQGGFLIRAAAIILAELLFFGACLFGSSDWWANIESGELPTHTITGIISRVFLSGHNDYPEFEIDSDGERTCWTRTTSSIPGCDLTRRELANLYRSGARVNLTYVEQRFKTPLPGVGEHSKCVLEIWIAPAV